jgi:hypothetical protein
MYDMLTVRELNVLQHMLFYGTEKAFAVVRENGWEPDSEDCHRGIHSELAHLFIEVATELFQRLEQTPAAA